MIADATFEQSQLFVVETAAGATGTSADLVSSTPPVLERQSGSGGSPVAYLMGDAFDFRNGEVSLVFAT